MTNPFGIGGGFDFSGKPVFGGGQQRPPLPHQYKIAEVATALGVSESTVRDWIAAGKLKAYKYGPRTIRIDAKDLWAIRKEISGGDVAK